jgi:hypothetical protein
VISSKGKPKKNSCGVLRDTQPGQKKRLCLESALGKRFESNKGGSNKKRKSEKENCQIADFFSGGRLVKSPMAGKSQMVGPKIRGRVPYLTPDWTDIESRMAGAGGLVYGFRHTDSPRFCYFRQARREIHTVTKDIFFLAKNISSMNSNSVP